MDIATIIGFLLAAGGVVFAMYHGTEGDFSVFFSTEGFVLVMGGAIGLAIMSMPLHAAKGLPAYIKKCFFHKDVEAKHLIEQIVQFAEIARRDGVLALENSVKTSNDPFMKKGLQLAIDGADPAIIEQVMSIELMSIEERHHHGRKMFELMGKYGPALGLTATLVGQVCMFRNMAAPAEGMYRRAGAAATIRRRALHMRCRSRFLGRYMERFLGECDPADRCATNSRCVRREEMFNKQIIIQGILAIQAGDNPRIVESKLLSFLSSKERAHMAPAGGGAKEK